MLRAKLLRSRGRYLSMLRVKLCGLGAPVRGAGASLRAPPGVHTRLTIHVSGNLSRKAENKRDDLLFCHPGLRPGISLENGELVHVALLYSVILK